MPLEAGTGFLHCHGHTLEVLRLPATRQGLPAIVMLHEGLGCVGLWGEFPTLLAKATGAQVVAYSRAGYGASSPVPLPRPLTYMHEEARSVLPAFLSHLGADSYMLLGHSDGASIATIYAGTLDDPRLRGLSLIAPHVVVEDMSVAAIAQARTAYETTDLRAKLAKWHANVDVAFRGWNDAWLDPAFRQWDLTDLLPHIHVPVQILQGTQDQYGTGVQIQHYASRCPNRPEVVMLEGVHHAPHREARAATVRAVTHFVQRL